MGLSVCKDSTWIYDIDNERCLKVSSEEKTYENAKDDCESMARKSTLASLIPSVGTQLEGSIYICIKRNIVYTIFILRIDKISSWNLGA